MVPASDGRGPFIFRDCRGDDRGDVGPRTRACLSATKKLSTLNVQKHLDSFNLESQFGTYSKIHALSGGQKVKVVLAAAMWMEPHVLILDEPTNFLDRDSLGALA